MNSAAEIVETSDSEERNEFEALSQSYWRRYARNSDVPSSPDASHLSWTKDKDSDDGSEAPHERIKLGDNILPSSSRTLRNESHLSSSPVRSEATTLVQLLDEMSPRFDLSSTPSPMNAAEEPNQDQAEEEVESRYPLRARGFRQLNPYEYDRLLYKRQMRANPEAIVAYLSPGRQRKKESTRAAELEDGWLVEDEVEDGHQSERRRAASSAGLQLQQTESTWAAETHYSRLIDEDGHDPGRRQMSSGRVGQEQKDSMLIAEPQELQVLDDDNHHSFEALENNISADDSDLTDANARPQSRSSSYKSASESGSESSGSSIVVFNAKATRQFRAWRRMQPAVMISKQLHAASENASSKRPRHDPTSDEDRPLLPGQTRVRFGERRGNAEIRGDTESSDSGPDELAEDGETGINKIPSSEAVETVHYGLQLAPPPRTPHSFDTSASEDDQDSSDISGVELSENDPIGLPSRVKRGPEVDMIDWMLKRTRNVGTVRTSKTKTSNRRPAYRKSHQQRTKGARLQARGPALKVVTSTARKFGPERQTLLSFKEVDRHATGVPLESLRRASPGNDDVEESTGRILQKHDDATKDVPRKRKRHRMQLGLYTFRSSGVRITSARTLAHPITIDLEDELLNEALAPLNERGEIRPGSQSNARPWNQQLDATKTSGVFTFDHDPNNIAPNARIERKTRISIDCGLELLPSGISFDPNTYLGKGYLYELTQLIQGNAEVSAPAYYAAYNIEFGPATSVDTLSEHLSLLCDHLSKLIFNTSVDAEEFPQIQNLMRAVCQVASWLASRAAELDHATLLAAVYDPVLQLVNRMAEITPQANTVTLSARWFCVEISVRVDCGLRHDSGHIPNIIRALARHLYLYGLENAMKSTQEEQDKLDAASTSQLAAELWICIIHTLGANGITLLTGEFASNSHPFWQLVQELVKDDNRHSTTLQASEATWRTILSLCTLSQFNVHGMTTSACQLPPSWDLATFALGQIRLSADFQIDKNLSHRKLKERDYIVRQVTSRCFLLWERWQWSLCSATPVFACLANIFRSRKFANLLGERADFAPFLLKNDIQLLRRLGRKDTAFDVFLKLIVQYKNDQSGFDGCQQALRKLLSLAVPVGSVPFSRVNPPTSDELSMLYNRFSAIAIAIHLDPSYATIQKRISEARRYVDFKEADFRTRKACVRSIHYYANLLRYHHSPMEHVLNWLGEMANILIDEYDVSYAAKPKLSGIKRNTDNPTVNGIHLLLGAVRSIILAHRRNLGLEPAYPDPGWLEGPWLIRVLNTKHLLTCAGTELHVRALIQTFLEARTAAVPQQWRPFAVNDTAEFTEDSQDEYDNLTLEIDWDDPGLDSALSGGVNPESEMLSKEERVCEIINRHALNAVYRMILVSVKNFSETNDDHVQEIDAWVHCWVGCVEILVKNGKKNWSTFINMHGTVSWHIIESSFWRRHVGYRFMITTLELAPYAYMEEKDTFLKMLMEALVAPNITIEHEYISQVFSVDGLKHLLLHDIACQPTDGVIFNITRQNFLDLRFEILNSIFSNLASEMKKTCEEGMLSNFCKICLQSVVEMFSTMKFTYEGMNPESDAQIEYSKLCLRTFDLMNRHVEFKTNDRLSSYVNWGKKAFTQTDCEFHNRYIMCGLGTDVDIVFQRVVEEASRNGPAFNAFCNCHRWHDCAEDPKRCCEPDGSHDLKTGRRWFLSEPFLCSRDIAVLPK